MPRRVCRQWLVVQVVHRRCDDAAFYALVAQDDAVKVLVRAYLLTQASKIDFQDRTRWCLGVFNREHLFDVAQAVMRLLYAMNYLEILDPGVFTARERTTLRNWFNGLAEVQYEASSRNNAAFWSGRLQGDYTPSSVWQPTATGLIPYYGGAPMPVSLLGYNNRFLSANSYLGIAGVYLGNQQYVDESKLVIKEFLMFGVHPAGYLGDFDRWWTNQGTLPDLGWKYAAATLTDAISVADVLARNGDTEPYEYTTADGMNGTEGRPKNLLFAIRSMLHYEDNTFDRYGTDQAAFAGNPAYRIDGRNITPGAPQAFSSGGLIPANLYYKDDYTKEVYTRTAPGSVDFLCCGYDPQDVYLRYPAPFFMFGQMEGHVWPYPD